MAHFGISLRGSSQQKALTSISSPKHPNLGMFDQLPMTDIPTSLDLGEQSPYKLNQQGFTARRYPSVLKSPPYTHASWNDEKILKEIYIPEIETLLLQVTGRRIAFTDSVVMRNSIHTEVDGRAREESAEEVAEFPKFVGTKVGAGGSPAPKIHMDYAPKCARTHIRKYHTRVTELTSEIVQAEDRLLAKGIVLIELKDHYNGPRWAMLRVWRPLKTVRRDPLALSDCRTFRKEDYVKFNVLFPSADGGESHKEDVFLAHGSEGHAWHWISDQRPDEVLIIQLFDSEAEKNGVGVAGGVMHSSAQIEGTEEEEARESVEVRSTVIW
jgi:GA4 desaturase